MDDDLGSPGASVGEVASALDKRVHARTLAKADRHPPRADEGEQKGFGYL